MASPSTDRRFGLNSSAAIKVPCRVATIANTTLSGEQTIDGVALVTGDRVLVWKQTNDTQNGIWMVDSGAWSRAVDFNDSRDATYGTIGVITGGAYQDQFYFLTTLGTIRFGTTSITFAVGIPDLAVLATASGSRLSGFIQSGAGAVASTVEKKLQQETTVHDYMTIAQIADSQTGIAPTMDVTAAFEAAQTAFDTIEIPPGRYALKNFRPKNKKAWIGSGHENTFIYQFTAADIAINCLSDVTVGQLLGVRMVNFQIIGHPAASTFALNVEAEGVYAITYSEFDLVIKNCYQALQIKCLTAAAVYHCKFNITVDTTTASPSVLSSGAYNEYDFFITNSGADGFAIHDTSSGALFKRLVTEGLVQLGGQRNHILNLQVENYIAAGVSPLGCAVFVSSTGHQIDNLTLITTANAKCGTGVTVFGTEHIISNYRVIGVAGGTAPQIPVNVTGGSQCTMINAQVVGTKLEDLYSGTDLRNWTFIGDCSTLITSPTIRGGNKFVYAIPSAGDTIFTTDNDDSVICDHAGLIATMTQNLPPTPKNQQTFRLTCVRFGITAITWVPGGAASIVGAPATLAGGASCSFVYSSAATTWYRLS